MPALKESLNCRFCGVKNNFVSIKYLVRQNGSVFETFHHEICLGDTAIFWWFGWSLKSRISTGPFQSPLEGNIIFHEHSLNFIIEMLSAKRNKSAHPEPQQPVLNKYRLNLLTQLRRTEDEELKS